METKQYCLMELKGGHYGGHMESRYMNSLICTASSIQKGIWKFNNEKQVYYDLYSKFYPERNLNIS